MGFLVNWARGQTLGSTLTPSSRGGLYLVAFLALNATQRSKVRCVALRDARLPLRCVALTRGTRARSKQGRGPGIPRFHIHHLVYMTPHSNRVQISPNEGSILLAISAFQSGQCASISAAAKIYKVPKTTLIHRIKGRPAREDYNPQNKRMSTVEEEVIVQNILKLDAQGLSPTISLVKEMADSICKARGGPPIGVNWAKNFIKRTPRLQVKLGRTYESQRRLCEDPQIIQGWFALVRNTINKYGILPQDIYNFDETGFQMGQISAAKSVTDASKSGRPKQVKPTNTQWVTLIQGACADGSTIPPFLVFKGKQLNHTWFHQGLPSTWAFTVSPNGWTTDQIGFQCIQHFEKHTRQKTVGSKRLLVLDNHGSHTTPEFRTFCEDNSIILLWMPPHSSHML